jgi:hypothetical protein
MAESNEVLRGGRSVDDSLDDLYRKKQRPHTANYERGEYVVSRAIIKDCDEGGDGNKAVS